ncbi:MAG: RING finger protein [Thermoplasmata archaeon]|nr:RING finger protein [Thermoplasmata archaeon]
MTRTGAAVLFTAFLIFSVVMGVFSTLAVPNIAAFESDDLRPPEPYTPASLPSLPAVIAGDTTTRPDIPVIIYVPRIFVNYGGSIRLNITNNDSRALIIEEVAFTWTGMSDSSNMLLNAEIGPGGTVTVKALAIDGPASSGNHDYQISMRVLQRRNNQWFRVVSASDEWLDFSTHTINVEALPESAENPVIDNPRNYYDKVNGLVQFNSEAVSSATEDAISGTEEDFDIGKACAIFDYLDRNLNYTTDANDGDIWYSPEETLSEMAGDCEDYALLLASMVHSAGGTSRIYLTADHAFAAVYVGNTEAEMENASSDVRAYYRTGIETEFFHDDFGYWMVADPLGSFHMGGIAVGQSPTEYRNGSWSTTFADSDTLYAIDVTGCDLDTPIWLEPNLWMGLILMFGFITAGFIVSAHTEKPEEKMICHICASEISGQEHYVCPECLTPYHRPCAFSRTACMNCGKPTVFPPPPPRDLPPPPRD